MEIGAEVFECGRADAFYSLEIFKFLVGGLGGVLFLILLAVFDDSAGHGGAEVGEGGEIVGGGDVGVDFVLEVGGAGGLEGLRVADSRGSELVADEEIAEDEEDEEGEG